MTKNTRIYNKFTGYTTEDCACEYCLYVGKDGACQRDECCCMDERQAALEREQGAKVGSTERSDAISCRA